MLTPGTNAMSVHNLLDIARRRKWLVILPAIAVAAAGAAYAYYRPVLYKAQALIGVESNARDYINRPEPNAKIQDQLLTIRETLLARPVLEPVIERYRLYPTPGGKVSDVDLEKMREKVKINVESDDSFHVGYEGNDRTMVMNVVNDVSNGFLSRLGDKRQKVVSTSTDELDAELARLRATLEQQEQQVLHYKARAVDSLPDRLDNNLKMYETTQVQLQSMSAAKSNDEARLAAVNTELAELQKQNVLNPTPVHEKTSQEIKLEELRLHVKQMRAVYTDQYPELLSAEREMHDLERTIAATPVKTVVAEPTVARMRFSQLKAEKEELEQRLHSYTQAAGSLQTDLGRLQSRVSSTPQHEIAISELNRGYEATKLRYNTLLSKQQEARLSTNLEKSSQAMSFHIIEPAQLPLGPSTPRRSRLILIALAAGLACGFGLAFAVEQMDSTLGSVAEFSAFTDLPVLTALPSLIVDPKARPMAAIPVIPTGGGSLHPVQLSAATLRENHIVSLTDPESVASEQYRMLGLKIRRKLSAFHSPVLAITSFIGGEGKTVTSLNLGLALSASISGRVLLIDGDLRKPRVHAYLGMEQGKGFSDLLLSKDQNADLGQYVWKLKDLYVMTGGTSLENPVSLLSSKNARDLIERLRGEFDLIIIDTPPVLPVVDAHVVAGMVDGVMMVVRARHTRREMIELGLQSFQGANILGAAINDLDFLHAGYAYAYTYNNSYTTTK